MVYGVTTLFRWPEETRGDQGPTCFGFLLLVQWTDEKHKLWMWPSSVRFWKSYLAFWSLAFFSCKMGKMGFDLQEGEDLSMMPLQGSKLLVSPAVLTGLDCRSGFCRTGKHEFLHFLHISRGCGSHWSEAALWGAKLISACRFVSAARHPVLAPHSSPIADHKSLVLMGMGISVECVSDIYKNQVESTLDDFPGVGGGQSLKAWSTVEVSDH